MEQSDQKTSIYPELTYFKGLFISYYNYFYTNFNLSLPLYVCIYTYTSSPSYTVYPELRHICTYKTLYSILSQALSGLS